LQDLKQLGCKIAIDDFGTGYSSLNYLKHLPIDRLKIDQSFVRDLTADKQDDAIISTIISMARHLQLEIIAEGVETPEQRNILLQKQCTHVQGYLYSPPLTPEDLLQQWEQLLQKAKTN
jgi:sensor c-di-GMP phosphodiesterase-like protein